jgi:hypothetical protein
MPRFCQTIAEAPKRPNLHRASCSSSEARGPNLALHDRPYLQIEDFIGKTGPVFPLKARCPEYEPFFSSQSSGSSMNDNFFTSVVESGSNDLKPVGAARSLAPPS